METAQNKDVYVKFAKEKELHDGLRTTQRKGKLPLKNGEKITLFEFLNIGCAVSTDFLS